MPACRNPVVTQTELAEDEEEYNPLIEILVFYSNQTILLAHPPHWEMYQRTLCVALTLAALVTADICSLCDCSPSTDPPGGLAQRVESRQRSS